MKPKRFGKTLPIRLPADIERRLKVIAASAGVTKSDALRMAVLHGLPQVESGRFFLDGPKPNGV